MLEIRGMLEGCFLARGNDVLAELEHLLFSGSFLFSVVKVTTFPSGPSLCNLKW